MTPKEKAQELFEQFLEHTVEWDKIKEIAFDSQFHAKQCALIAVDEILKSHNNLYGVNSEKTKYYLEVQHEIEKI
jgi:hypothetical protein